MGILATASPCTKIPPDNMFVIYGAPGSGKTTLASTFPKTKDKPMLYIDVLEGGAGVIPVKDREFVHIVSVTKYEEIDEIIGDLYRGYTMDDKGNKIELHYSSIVIDSLTQMEYLLKEYLKTANNKDVMSLNLWGQAKDNSEYIFNTLRIIQTKTKACVVAICHEKALQDEDNPSFNKLIPSLMTSAALSLCAKASFVFYTKVEEEQVVDPKTNDVTTKLKFMTYIDTHKYLLSKCRKPKDFACPNKVENLTYNRFKANILDKIV